MALDQIEEEGKEMSFLDHLEELRWHLIRSVASILVFSIAAFVFKDFIWGTVILGPTESDFWTYRFLCDMAELLEAPLLCFGDIPMELINTEITAQFTVHIKSSLIIGLALGFPYIFWEIWRFVKPGLHPTERNASRGIVFVVSLLFISGVLFGYFVVTPLSINFLSNYSLAESINNQIKITSIVSLVATLALACGFMFQLPIATYILAKAGIISPQLMKTYRKHAVVVILVVSAIITPPDVISQILIALPLMLLYEISIKVCKRVVKKAEKKRKEEDKR
ncbi:MAG: twin-arginine translocase subunit TatC [Roseivirga sp.]|nr:twin-arginine translocase subunit TatC [Roseivirga sp.]